jgi:hypothetical protein
MSKDQIRGRTIRFQFADGPMAKKTYEHVFDAGGTVKFYEVSHDAKRANARVHEQEPGKTPDTYQAAHLSGDVWAVSYLSAAGGFTLTVVLDFATHKLVAFSSNEKKLDMQHGTFEVDAPARTGSHDGQRQMPS